MFSCEFYEISKNTFFIEHLRATASVHPNIFYWFLLVDNRTMQIKSTAALLKMPANLLERHKETQAQTFFRELPKK